MNNNIVVLASNATSWNLIPNALVILVLSHLFTIILFTSFTFICVACNQLHIIGLRLFIFKSTHGFCPLSICSLMIDVVHVLNSTLNACFSGHCKITSASCSSFVQFTSMKMTIMLGWSFSYNLETPCSCVQTSNSTTIPFYDVLINLIVQFVNVDMVAEFCEQIFLWSQGLTNDSH